MNQLQPYMNMSADQSAAMGNSNAAAGDDQQLVRIDASGQTALRGAVNGFQSRMAIEPVGNLHLERIEMYPAGIDAVSCSTPCR